MKTKSYLGLWSCAFLCGLLALSGCHQARIFQSERDTVVFVLFDISGSTNSPQIRQGYIHDLDTIAQLLAREGGTLKGDVIGSEALNTSTIPIDVVFPSYNVVLSTDKKHSQQIAADNVQQFLERILGAALGRRQSGV